MARVIFLGGLGRSGTTLIERVLGEVPGVCALGEVVHLWQRDLRDDERCGCGVPFSGCDFWERVGVAAFGGWHRVDVHRVLALRDLVERTRHIPRLATRVPHSYAELVREYADYYVRVYDAAATVAGASVVVDSSKHSALAHVLRYATDPALGDPALDLRVLHVVRDARGVAYSWTKKVRRPESADDEMTRYAPAQSALLWTAHNAAFGLLRRRGVRVRRLRYEEFLADPQSSLRKLVAYAGLDPSAVDLGWLEADHVTLGVSHSAAGNPMRFTTGRLPLHRDDAWRDRLAPRQRAVVSAVCAPMLKAYGYDLRVGGQRPAAEQEVAA